jgi:hypothetical protein
MAAIVPLAVTVVFVWIWLHDRTHGGYRIVKLTGVEQEEPTLHD